jgi:hypothetical protein
LRSRERRHQSSANAEAARQLLSYFAFPQPGFDEAADGIRLSMSLARVEIEGLGRASLAFGKVEHHLEDDDGQIEKQHRQSPSFTALRPFPLTT